MSVRFRKKVNIIPRILWLNVSKTGTSVTFGIQGLITLNIGKLGLYITLGLPSTGLSYRKRLLPIRRKPTKTPMVDEQSS